MIAPWPFAQWGLNIMGPFPIAVRQLKFLIVGIDYFTKWVELKPWLPLQRRTYEASSGGTSSAGMESLGSWSQIMGNNSTTTPSGIFAHSWGSKITTPPLPTLKLTDQLKSRINPYSKLSRLDSRWQRAYGRKSCQAYYGCTGQQEGHLHERHHLG